MRLTVRDIVKCITQLDPNERYHYVNPATSTVIIIHDIVQPEGPIYIKRWDPSSGQSPSNARRTSISTEMMARIANAFVPNHPINFDRVLGASYNTRSALEALLVHTPEFYFCYPGRFDSYIGDVKAGHKHVIWCPDDPHRSGVMMEKETEIVISEMTFEASHDALDIPSHLLNPEIDIEVARQHARIQIALILIGQQLGFRTWVAQNDRGIKYKDRTLGEMESVLDSLDGDVVIRSWQEAIRSARLIDVIWFGNHRYMPAVMEIEHSTGVTSGLTRMKGLQEQVPSISTRYVVVAADDLRDDVTRKANLPQFQSLSAKYFPYSAVLELYQLCQRRRIKGVTPEFIDSFIEEVVGTG